MSEPLRTTSGVVIKWDRPDRMRKSLRLAGMSVQEMADYLDVDRSTVSTWINGRIEPTYTTQRLWALRTGVPFTWLHHGDTQPCDLEVVEIPPESPQVSAKVFKMQRKPSVSWAG